jgi:hypothetical protein
MLTLHPRKLADLAIPVGTGWLLGACMEARGKQDLWLRQKPEVLEVLREQAIIQSVESSNRIEGVTVAASRLRPLVIGKARPRDRSDFQVVRYISLERLIEERKEEYYRVLELCSRDWHEGKNEIIPWWNFFVGVLRRAYKEFERQVQSLEARLAKSDLVRQTVLSQVEAFTLADMASQLPAASSQLIKKVLSEMKGAGRVRLVGRGRGARWEVVR